MLYAVSAVKENVMKSLEIMGYGVLAVFIVIAILIILVKLMQYIEKRIAKNKEKEGSFPVAGLIVGRTCRDRLVVGFDKLNHRRLIA